MTYLSLIAFVAVMYFIATKAVVPAGGGGCCGHAHHENEHATMPAKQA